METQELHRGRLLDHLQLVVRDLPASRTFYAAVLEVLNVPIGGSADDYFWADELFVSVERLLEGRDLDAVVVELSGVADPMAIKNNWKMAPPEIRSIADVARVVTLVDANTFGTDFMTWDLAGERSKWVDPADECAGSRKVAELLAEQVEAADLILVNKVDMATDEETKVASSVAKALNGKADIMEVEFGIVNPKAMIGLTIPTPTPLDHEDVSCKDADCTDSSHSHSHDHAEAACVDSGCTDTSHSHSHDHADAEAACAEPGCTDKFADRRV